MDIYVKLGADRAAILAGAGCEIVKEVASCVGATTLEHAASGVLAAAGKTVVGSSATVGSAIVQALPSIAGTAAAALPVVIVGAAVWGLSDMIEDSSDGPSDYDDWRTDQFVVDAMMYG